MDMRFEVTVSTTGIRGELTNTQVGAAQRIVARAIQQSTLAGEHPGYDCLIAGCLKVSNVSVKFLSAICGHCEEGVRLPSEYKGYKPPRDGYQIVERCDVCEKYDSDWSAAEAWGIMAEMVLVANGAFAIAMPRKR